MKKKNVNPQYHDIRKKKDYLRLLLSGMFYEFFPELYGDWKADKKMMKK
ncbi:hypothetical protein [uncultured Mediterranean phage uvMED]|nr:hypothetical protein [uncultured Mediterranean phage uvMED]BAR22552.1 hypothetical protein [uncultured Mediterranean phage uvMED]